MKNTVEWLILIVINIKLPLPLALLVFLSEEDIIIKKQPIIILKMLFKLNIHLLKRF